MNFFNEKQQTISSDEVEITKAFKRNFDKLCFVNLIKFVKFNLIWTFS